MEPFHLNEIMSKTKSQLHELMIKISIKCTILRLSTELKYEKQYHFCTGMLNTIISYRNCTSIRSVLFIWVYYYYQKKIKFKKLLLS